MKSQLITADLCPHFTLRFYSTAFYSVPYSDTLPYNRCSHPRSRSSPLPSSFSIYFLQPAPPLPIPSVLRPLSTRYCLLPMPCISLLSIMISIMLSLLLLSHLTDSPAANGSPYTDGTEGTGIRPAQGLPPSSISQIHRRLADY